MIFQYFLISKQDVLQRRNEPKLYLKFAIGLPSQSLTTIKKWPNFERSVLTNFFTYIVILVTKNLDFRPRYISLSQNNVQKIYIINS